MTVIVTVTVTVINVTVTVTSTVIIVTVAVSVSVTVNIVRTTVTVLAIARQAVEPARGLACELGTPKGNIPKESASDSAMQDVRKGRLRHSVASGFAPQHRSTWREEGRLQPHPAPHVPIQSQPASIPA